MEWLKAVYGTVVGLDTAPLIYFIEKYSTCLPLLLPFFEAVERGDIHVVTSTLTLTEVLVHAYRDGNRALPYPLSSRLSRLPRLAAGRAVGPQWRDLRFLSSSISSKWERRPTLPNMNRRGPNRE